PADETALLAPAAPPELVAPSSRAVARATLAAETNGVAEGLVSLLEPTGFEAEQYRRLRTVLEQRRDPADAYVVAVSSPSVGDGKTTTTLNLAGALAQARDAR